MLPKRVFLQPSKLLYDSKKILNKQFNFYSVFGFPLSSRGVICGEIRSGLVSRVAFFPCWDIAGKKRLDRELFPITLLLLSNLLNRPTDFCNGQPGNKTAANDGDEFFHDVAPESIRQAAMMLRHH
jgi:hypothetical protein